MDKLNKFKYKDFFKNITIVFLTLIICFTLCLFIHYMFKDDAPLSAVFVLGVFIISLITPGYIYGIFSALLSVLAVNFAFTFPYFAFNFTIPENIVSAIILMVVTVIGCTLSTKIKHIELLKTQRDKERMRANLLRALSHDVRTPLTTIYSSSIAMLENYDSFSSEQIKKMLKGVSDDSKWLYKMFENLLSITKLDGDNVKIIKTDTLLDELIDSAIMKFSKIYPDQKVIIDIPDEFIIIPIDALLIEQVIINILENAVEHAEGMTVLKLSILKKQNKVIFEITDDGKGIDKDKIEDVFSGIYTNNYKLSDNKKRNAGIGLSVCASIIRAHGGQISAKNLKKRGCTFKFTLYTEEDNAN